ncbi:hypothetical protein BC477_02835 [Clavibacter michiganensis subsp. michiganensis]|uniref:Uncharacterized protein n=1 Tax=Clavibacter michiganensis subsp. michiganensis TaxID=33013 RepID=A0A251XJN2_CLAMM|nr:hypothetical protein BC477_02835 [Clavibacter michiganensis subsp. michiganensis]OUE03647.1 hypothetical protein CMMCAS07_01770 [Clavibacter michiganensis subsp. michiganensis]
MTAGLVWWKTDPADPWLGQVVMIGVTLLAVSPRYPWYALLLIPFIAMTGRGEWFAVVAALALRLFAPDEWAWQIALVTALVIVVAGSLVRLGRRGARASCRPGCGGGSAGGACPLVGPTPTDQAPRGSARSGARPRPGGGRRRTRRRARR